MADASSEPGRARPSGRSRAWHAIDLLAFPVALGAVVNSLVGAVDALVGLATTEPLRFGLSLTSVAAGLIYQRMMPRSPRSI